MSIGIRQAYWTWARNRGRLLPDVLLVFGAVAGVVLAAIVQDVAWIAVWIGLAATLAVAAIVDVSAVAEQDRRLQPIRSAAGRRVGRLHQILLKIVDTTFDDLEAASATEWPAVLRAAHDGPIDLSMPANVFPPRSRQQRITELSRELDSCLDELMSLSAAGRPYGSGRSTRSSHVDVALLNPGTHRFRACSRV